MLKYVGGRKAIAAITVLVLGMVAVFVKGDIPPGLLQLLEVVFSAFVAGNLGSKIVAVSRLKAEAPSAPVSEPVSTNEVELQNITSGIINVQQLLQLIIKRAGIDKMPDPS